MLIVVTKTLDIDIPLHAEQADRIRSLLPSLKIGMTSEELEALLGVPQQKERRSSITQNGLIQKALKSPFAIEGRAGRL